MDELKGFLVFQRKERKVRYIYERQKIKGVELYKSDVVCRCMDVASRASVGRLTDGSSF